MEHNDLHVFGVDLLKTIASVLDQYVISYRYTFISDKSKDNDFNFGLVVSEDRDSQQSVGSDSSGRLTPFWHKRSKSEFDFWLNTVFPRL